MSPVFGPDSFQKLQTCHDELQMVCYEVIHRYDFKIICGHRGEKEQDAAYHAGFSNKRWPYGQHNSSPSNAIDIAPWHAEKPHIRWDNEREFIYLAGHMVMAANMIGVKLRWGGDWDEDTDLYDRNLPWDLGHFERKE